MKRRDFFKVVSAGGIGMAMSPIVKATDGTSLLSSQDEIVTNLEDALKVPRTANSMPGKYPGKVVKVVDDNSVVDGEPSEERAYRMIASAMLSLTGEKNLKKAWRQFVSPKDVIGLKVNPVAGPMLTTSHAVTKSVVKQLEEAGIPRKNLVIWDRRDPQLKETGYTTENYPGIEIVGTEYHDEKGSFYNESGVLYGEERVDKNHYFRVNIKGEYDAYNLPYQVNGGEYSYFTKICTQKVDKIINLPILKNAGAAVTLCMKNLAFGSISNTSRLHGPMWHKTCAFVCAFPPLRDKVVLNIVDGLKGCYDGGPGANPQFFHEFKTIMVGTDPVAVDRIGHEIVIPKRIEEGRQDKDSPAGYLFATMAQDLKLGVADRDKIELKEINLS